VLGVVGRVAATPHIGVQGKPISLAEPSQGALRSGRIAAAGGQHDRPMRGEKPRAGTFRCRSAVRAHSEPWEDWTAARPLSRCNSRAPLTVTPPYPHRYRYLLTRPVVKLEPAP